MTRRLLLGILTLCLSSSAIAQHDLGYFRDTFHSNNSKESLEKLIKTESEEFDPNNQNTIKAYKAVCESMLANYLSSPYSKLKAFNSGKGQLEDAIKNNPVVEVRYLRLLLQLNVPKLLNYHANIDEDLEVVGQELKNQELSIEERSLFKKTLLSSTTEEKYLSMINNINID